jgi:hypothetical protein
MKIKQILIVLTIVIFSSVVSYRLGVLAQITGSLKSIAEPGSMVTEASYVIFTYVLPFILGMQKYNDKQ